MSKKKKKFFGSNESEEASKPGDDSVDESQEDATETKPDEVKPDDSNCRGLNSPIDETVAPEAKLKPVNIPGKYRKFQ